MVNLPGIEMEGERKQREGTKKVAILGSNKSSYLSNQSRCQAGRLCPGTQVVGCSGHLPAAGFCCLFPQGSSASGRARSPREQPPPGLTRGLSHRNCFHPGTNKRRSSKMCIYHVSPTAMTLVKLSRNHLYCVDILSPKSTRNTL